MSTLEFEGDRKLLTVYSVLGHKTELSHIAIRSCVSQAGFVVFMLLVIAVFLMFDLYNYVEMFGLWPASVLWVTGLSLNAVLYVLILMIFIELKQRLTPLVVYLPIVGFVSMTISTFTIVALSTVYSGTQVDWSEALRNLPLNLPLGLIFETIFFIFVKPTLDENSRLRKRKSPNPKRTIRLSGEEIEVSKIVYLRAQDHYVDIVTADGISMIRARLKDFTSQLSKSEGMTPHRSYWIAWHHIVSVEMSQNSASLTMSDGHVLPIAKQRIREFESEVVVNNISIERTIA